MLVAPLYTVFSVHAYSRQAASLDEGTDINVAEDGEKHL